MAGGMDLGGTGRGGKKALDTAINMVPFIDLMAVTISFLIMTAVWTQLGRLQVSQAAGPTVSPEPPSASVPITLELTETEARLSVQNVPLPPFPLVRTNGKPSLDALGAKLREVKSQFADQQALTLRAEDSVRYEDLVRVIDLCIGAGLPSVSVEGA